MKGKLIIRFLKEFQGQIEVECTVFCLSCGYYVQDSELIVASC